MDLTRTSNISSTIDQPVFSEREADGYFHELVDRMPEGAVKLRSDGVIHYCNRHFENILSAAPGFLSGINFSSLIVPDDFELWKKTAADAAQSPVDIRLTAFEQESVPCRIRVFDLPANGVSERAILVCDRREELARQNALKQRIEEAEHADRMKDSFLATVSHELRTPLNLVYGHAQILTWEDTDSADRKNSVEAILRNVQLQMRIVDDILDLSKIISGKMVMHRRLLNVKELVEDIVASMKICVLAKGLTIELQTVDQPVFIDGDPDRIRQVICNLIVNALKFTPKGGLVEIAVRKVDRDVEVSVRDTGEGISPEFIPRIFSRFSQEDASSTRRHSGLGLGLAIVHHIVESHGGQIAVESKGKGQGALFTMRIPLLSGERLPIKASL